PPLDPALNLGYFEYIENEFADVQGEDSDDCLRFTAKAPAGQPFTGRAFLFPSALPGGGTLTRAQLTSYLLSQPVTITSEYAEIIYFLRNGNLYRRVLLIAPEMQTSIAPSAGNQFFVAGGLRRFSPGALGALPVSWQGVNDLSAHP